ncbi:Protein of unknown function [Salinimicrobium sediminis]|uniref:ATP-dependent exonuclease n=1 Tax=Salinimicrobium sediminis TaxID=1343891 RepID=A0A285X331_9FLAO|nr:DUF3108 domain-containing protein [Salinimicrobium sediminis]MDX1751812.1 DUF3108 domain-containing protein [Salinimicrobium sediminis]SOC79154.1 Protein of unknown function [Salinimicrobium sediminis]
MKKIFAVIISLIALNVSAQSHQAFQDGEWFRFRVHYGMVNAGFATLEVKETTFKNQPVYHVVGKGNSTGMVHVFFKVDDNYESFMHKETGMPLRFIRQIDEGGHTRDLLVDFDHENGAAHVFNRKHNERNTYKIPANVQDMISSFYHLRNNLDVKELEAGEMHSIKMFLDDEIHDFQLKFLGREVVKTKLGNIAALKFQPYVLAGRVFEKKEGLTMWVSDDKNRMPIKIKANLAVGSLDADIDAFKGLKHPLNIIMD